MKKIFLVLLMMLTSLFAEVKYTEMFDAYDIAEKENKLVLVMLSQKGCPGCQYMENVVFANKDISEYLAKEYITVHLDVHEDAVPMELEHFATPTFYFLDAEENILKRLDGGENAKDFLITLKAVRNKK